MTPLLVLGFALLALWAFGLIERGRRAWWMQGWEHVPLFGSLVCLTLALLTPLVS